MGLSKTEFLRGMQCPKQLWLDTNKALSDLCKLWCALHTGGSISFKRKGISDLFNAAFGDMSAEERNRAFSALLKLYGNALLESCDNLKTVYSSYT